MVRVNRTLTKQFIDALPTTVVLTPHAQVRKPAGGFVWEAGEPREPLVVTLSEQSTIGGEPRPQITVDGVERVVDFELVAEWDAPIARFDSFTHQGKEWDVIDLYYDNGYEVRALVSARG